LGPGGWGDELKGATSGEASAITCVDCRLGNDSRETAAAQVRSLEHARKLGETMVRLPLGGVASTNAQKVRHPLVRPLWLLAATAIAAVALFVWLRLRLL